MVSGVKDDRLI